MLGALTMALLAPDFWPRDTGAEEPRGQEGAVAKGGDQGAEQDALSSLPPELVQCLASLLTYTSCPPLPSSLPAWPRSSLTHSSLTNSLISAPSPSPSSSAP